MKVTIGNYYFNWNFTKVSFLPYWLAEGLNRVFFISAIHRAFKLDKKSSRYIDVKISDDDLWELDNTMAIILLACLKEIDKKSKGVPLVENKDVSEELFYDGEDYKIPDDLLQKRWRYVFDKIIFSFETIVACNETEFDSSLDFNIEIQEKVDEGLILFGKYFRSFWM